MDKQEVLLAFAGETYVKKVVVKNANNGTEREYEKHEFIKAMPGDRIILYHDMDRGWRYGDINGMNAILVAGRLVAFKYRLRHLTWRS